MPAKTNFRALEMLIDCLLADRMVQQEPVHTLVPEILVSPNNYSCRFVPLADERDFLIGAIRRLQSFTGVNRNTKKDEVELGSTSLIDLRSQATLNGRHGTFLSLIPWIAYFVCELGCHNVVLLPLGPYGETRRKGKDGSLFSIADHTGVDDRYADKLVPQLSAREQYQAVIEAAACADARVGAVQPLATAAIDYSGFARDPSLTFWWAADPSEVLYAPVLDDDVASSIATRMFKQGSGSLWNARPKLPKHYAERFVEPPSRNSIRLVQRDEGIYYVGKSLHRGRMVDVAIANAIPDVIPDKADKYAWRDIALVNYWQTHIPCPAMLMGYVPHNTRSSAMNLMKGVMRERSRRYGESLFWLDMARCLPPNVRNSAPISIPVLGSPKLIYEQITGNGPIWQDRLGTVVGEFLCNIAPRAATRSDFRSRLFSFLSTTGIREQETCYLAGAGTHDSITAEPRIAALLMLLANILPGAQLLIVSGHERFSSMPINAEFGDVGSSAYNESRLGLFSFDPKAVLSGMSANTLAKRWNLPTVSQLLRPAGQLQGYVRQCRTTAAPMFSCRRETSDRRNTIGCWKAGRRPYGPWCVVMLRIDDDDMASVAWEKDWKIVLRPLVSGGWQADYRPQYMALKSVDLIIIGGEQLAQMWKTCIGQT